MSSQMLLKLPPIRGRQIEISESKNNKMQKGKTRLGSRGGISNPKKKTWLGRIPTPLRG